MSRCTPTCRQPSPSMAHCPTCHRTFGGVWGFDRHRRNGACVDPQTLGMVDRDGVWRTPMDMDTPERLRPSGGAA
jgi:hypothetical protein